ncbi:MAG: hypothetical protein LC105_05590 [Chitinophagales bacterium]|nr:hypothetical protein [Chitinophagales bacterium]MCZ2393306.1 hypothetical protein [Chitinophagales bacterium]
MMKNIVVFFIFSAFLVSSLFAQKTTTNHAQLRDLKVAYFNERLQLTKSEALQFWEVYDRYEKERLELKQLLKKRENLKKSSEMSDTEIYDFMNNYFVIKEKELVVQKKYFDELKKILPAQKWMKLVHIEEQFRKYLFKQAQLKNKNSPITK